MSAEPPQHISRPVSRVLYGEGLHPRVTAIPLRRRLPGAFSNLPGRPDPDTDPGDCSACAGQPPRRPYSVLLPVGFAVPPTLPPTRCALTAPFHPCRPSLSRGRRSVLCGTFPGLTPAGRYPAPHVHGARTFLPRPPFGIGTSGRPAD